MLSTTSWRAELRATPVRCRVNNCWVKEWLLPLFLGGRRDHRGEQGAELGPPGRLVAGHTGQGEKTGLLLVCGPGRWGGMSSGCAHAELTCRLVSCHSSQEHWSCASLPPCHHGSSSSQVPQPPAVSGRAEWGWVGQLSWFGGMERVLPTGHWSLSQSHLWAFVPYTHTTHAMVARGTILGLGPLGSFWRI